MTHANLRRSRAAALGVSLLAAAALLVPAAVAAQSLPETVTVSWQLPVAPTVKLDVEDAVPSNFAAVFPQVYVAQIDGANLGSEDLLPSCGYVQEDVYLLQSQKDVDLLASLEANGLTLSNGKAGDSSIVQHWIFEYAGDCSTPTPSESASPTDSGHAHSVGERESDRLGHADPDRLCGGLQWNAHPDRFGRRLEWHPRRDAAGHLDRRLERWIGQRSPALRAGPHGPRHDGCPRPGPEPGEPPPPPLIR